MEVHPHIACINCDGPIADPKPPYLFCSEWCRQIADYVRYHRRILKDGRVNDPEVMEALRIKRAFVVSGGYDAKGRELKPEVRALIIQRDKGLCYVCGQPGNEIDHTFEHKEVDKNDPMNLRLICHKCHIEKTEKGLRAISEIEDDEERQRLEALSKELKERVHARKLKRSEERR